MVTDILATETDTGVGDVHEATARAVWRAVGVTPQRPYAGFSEPDLVAAWLRDRIGLRLLTVTEARHWHRGRREPDMDSLVHAWLHFEHRPPVQVHGLGDELLLHTGSPYPPYDMGEYGEIRVGPAALPDLLAGLGGARLVNAAVILASFTDSVCAGLLLRLDTTDVMIGTLCDEWVLATRKLPPQVQPYWTIQPWVHPA